MGRAISAAVCLALLLGAGCGSREPSERDIWHSSSLRPGRESAQTAGERELLARIDELPSEEPVALAGDVFVLRDSYHAASGRSCRPLTVHPGGDEGSAWRRLACEERDRWVFVPDVIEDGAAPETRTDPADPPSVAAPAESGERRE